MEYYIGDIRVIRSIHMYYYVQKFISISMFENDWVTIESHIEPQYISEKYQRYIPTFKFEPIKERGERNCFTSWATIESHIEPQYISEKYQRYIPTFKFEPIKERGERNCFTRI